MRKLKVKKKEEKERVEKGRGRWKKVSKRETKKSTFPEGG